MDTRELTKRLILVKHLESLGHAQSRLLQPYCSTALLMYHDAIEHFLFLAGLHLQVSNIRRQMSFEALLEAVNKHTSGGLELTAEIRRLNTTRVAFKHSMVGTSSEEVKEFSAYVRSFLINNAKRALNIDYVGFSEPSLVESTKARKMLESALSLIHSEDLHAALLDCHLAFDTVLADYGNRLKAKGLYSPLFPGAMGKQVYRRRIADDFSWTNDIERFFVPMAESVDSLHNRVDELHVGFWLISLGVSTDDYRRFKRTQPNYFYAFDGSVQTINQKEQHLRDIAELEFAVSFVVDFAVRLQSADPAAYDENSNTEHTNQASQKEATED